MERSAIVPIEGPFHRRLRCTYRPMAWDFTVGEMFVTLPAHWLDYLREGAQVRAEAYFRPLLDSEGKEAPHRAPILVSLDDRLFVDREVPLGLLRLRDETSVVVGSTILALAAGVLIIPDVGWILSSGLGAVGTLMLGIGLPVRRRNREIQGAIRVLNEAASSAPLRAQEVEVLLPEKAQPTLPTTDADGRP